MPEAQDRIAALIKSLEPDVRIIGKADEKTIEMIESWLKVSLPESYKWFLYQYSLIMMPNYIIYGVGNNTEPACLTLTLGVRESGLPTPYVVIENDGDGRILCLDTSRNSDGDCPVVGWETRDGKVKDVYPGFFQLLEAKLTDTRLVLQSRKLS
jgi:hypothetical protein